MTTPSDFIIATADELEITDSEITAMLMTVYVEGGFTPREEAISLFEPSIVRKRGAIIAARHKPTLKLSGFVIVVPHDSTARRFAGENEEEVHLFGNKCLKVKGNAFLVLQDNKLMFKLTGNTHKEAMSQKGAVLWNPSGKNHFMKAWVAMPALNLNNTESLVTAALS